MPTYIALMRLTDKGFTDIKEAPQRMDDVVKGIKTAGGKCEIFYTLMGDYDYVVVGECPSDETAATFLLLAGSIGNVRGTIIKAFTKEEFAEMVKKLP